MALFVPSLDVTPRWPWGYQLALVMLVNSAGLRLGSVGDELTCGSGEEW